MRARRTGCGAADSTLVATRTGVACACFVIEASSRRIVGRRVAAHMRAPMVLYAVETARRSRGTRLAGLAARSDAGTQLTSLSTSEPTGRRAPLNRWLLPPR